MSSSEQFIGDERPDYRDFIESLFNLRQFAFDTVLDGYNLSTICELFNQDSFSLSAVIRCNDDVNGGEYWEINASQQGRQDSNDSHNTIRLTCLTLGQDNCYRKSLLSYTLNGSSFTEKYVSPNGEAVIRDISNAGQADVLIKRLYTGVIVNPEEASKIVKKHNSFVSEEFSNTI